MSRKTAVTRRRFFQSAGAGAAGCAVAAALPASLQAQDCQAKKKPQAAGSPVTAGSQAKKLKSHKYEQLLPEQFYEEWERAPIAYWSCGAMEEHGLHNPLGTDPLVAYEVCLRAAEISGGIVFPSVPFAPAGMPSLSRSQLRARTKELYAPSLWTSVELCRQVYLELLESLADLGFKACVACSGHWPAEHLLEQIQKEHGGRIGAMKFWGGGVLGLVRDWLQKESKREPLAMGHGMMWETSLMMAVHPDWADLPRAQRIKDGPLLSQLSNQPQPAIDYIAKANAEYGNRAITLAAQKAAELARGLLS